MRRLLNIQSGEERLAFLLFAEMFLLGIGFNFVETSSFPLFLSEFDAGTLPYIYIINGITVALLTALYIRLGRRLAFTRQLLGLLAFVFLLTLGVWLALILGGGRAVTFTLPVLFQIAVNLAQLGFWTMTARLMTLRQSKRLFGPIGGGMWVAIVLTGFLIPFIVRAIGTVNLLLVSAAGFGSALLLLVYITRTYRSELDTTGEHGAITAAPEISAARILKNPYVLLMFGLTLVAWLSFFFIDNIFFNRLSAQFPTQAEQSSFLGLYLAALGIFTLINNTFLTGYVINRYGIRVGLLILPVSLFVVTFAFASVGLVAGIVPVLFWLATLNRVLDLGLLFSVDQTAQAILYQPLPAADRTRIQTIDSGIVRMIAVGLAGALLLLLNQVLAFDVVQLGIVLLVIVIVWLVGVVQTNRAYPRVLAAALSRRRLTGVSLSLEDSVTVGVLKESLADPRPGPALYAFRLLADGRPDILEEALPGLLTHPAQAVRLEAINRIEPHHPTAGRLRSVADNDADPAVRGAAWQALAATGDSDVAAALLTHLNDEEPAVRLAAITGLRRHGDQVSRARAEDELAFLAKSSNPADRLLAVRALSTANDKADCDLLSPLLRDPDNGVRREALAAAGRIACPTLWPEVISALDSGAVRHAAVNALVAGGESALPVVTATMARDGLPPGVRASLAQACGRIGGAEAIDALLIHVGDPDNSMRSAVLQGLSNAGYRATGQSVLLIRDRITAEISHAAWLLAGLRDCLQAPELAYLRRVLQDQFEAARERVYLLLSLLYDSKIILDARDALRHDRTATQARRSYALELLDLRLPSDLKALVIPLSEDLSPQLRLQRLGSSFAQPNLSPADRVEALTRGDGHIHRWLKVTEVYAAGQMRCSGPDLMQLLDGYQRDADPVLRETAAWTAARIKGKGAEQSASGVRTMLSTIEKVIILKDVELFAETPDELLTEVAGLLTEVEVAPGESVFAKGDNGDSFYIIVNGEVRVHDGAYTINTLGESEVFGEMALLDPEPRMASVTAEGDTLLLRLDQDPFYELMDARSEVARGIIRVLSNRLRLRVQEVATLRSNLTPTNS